MRDLILPGHQSAPEEQEESFEPGDDEVHVVCCEDASLRLCGLPAEGVTLDDDTPVTCVVCAEADNALSQLYEGDSCGGWCPRWMTKERAA